MRAPVKPYSGPFVGDEKRRRKFLLFPRTIGNERVWLEWVWRVSQYRFIPSWDEHSYGWRFDRYEATPRTPNSGSLRAWRLK